MTLHSLAACALCLALFLPASVQAAAPKTDAKTAPKKEAAKAPAAADTQKADCEAYHAADAKFTAEQGFKVAPKKDEFVAACMKLPAALAKCHNGDLKYATAHSAECDKLLQDNLKDVMALRKLLMAE